jgi:DNA-binding response OmpR family regulator
MTTVLLAMGDNTLRNACKNELHAAGHATLVLDRPLAALSLAAKVSWDVLLVDDTSFGRDAVRTAGSGGRVLSIGATLAGVHETLPLPLQSGRLLSALARSEASRRPGLTLDATRRVARVNGSEAPLTRIEYRLLEALYEHRPDDMTLDRLLQDVWGSTEGMGTAELVRTHIRNLRLKLSQLGLPDAIRSHRGRGYALEA